LGNSLFGFLARLCDELSEFHQLF